jgi:hypothetical protein
MAALDPRGLTPTDARWLRDRYDPWRWASETARIRLPKASHVIDLESRPFLRDIYRDMAPEIVVMKGAQLGMSSTALVRAMWMLTTFPTTAIWTMPTARDVGKFTQGRINPIIRGSQYLLDRIVDVDSVMQKQFLVAPGRKEGPRQRGLASVDPRSTIYFSGASTEKDAVSMDADLLVHDEEDLSDPQIIDQFEHRLDASRFGWRFHLSTPRLPGAGIDAVFQITDRRRWLVRCPGCNSEFEMAFPGGPWPYANIEPDPTGWAEGDWARWEEDGRPARFFCHRCGRSLTPADRAAGRWVPEAPMAGRAHGYAISQLAAPWLEATRILLSFKRHPWRSDFWNLAMGIPWDEGTNAFTRAAIMSRCDETSPMAVTGQGCTMGVDVGAKFDVVVGTTDPSGTPRTIWFGRVDSYDDLDVLMRRYGVATCVIDAAPEEHATRAWAARYNRPSASPKVSSHIIVWRASYGSSSRPGVTAQVSWNDETGIVVAPRTEILSSSANELLERRILPRYEPNEGWLAYVAHHVASKKVPIWVAGLETERVLDHYEWHQVGPDHLFHAATYEMMARQASRSVGGPPLVFYSFRRRRPEDRAPTTRAPSSALPIDRDPAFMIRVRRRTG